MRIKSEKELRTLYDLPKSRALEKALKKLEKHSINIIESSPFFILGTANTAGELDCSPRGGKAGFVKILNDSSLVIPDAKGNNRLDSLTNIIDTGRIACLFFIPGIEETLRLNGWAYISNNEEYLDLFKDETNPPMAVIIVKIEELFLHCAKALMRSDLWGDTYKVVRPGFPTIGEMINEQLGSSGPVESQSEMENRYKKEL